MQVNYWPSTKSDDSGSKGKEASEFFNVQHEHISGERYKGDIGDNNGQWDDYKQAGDRWRSMGAIRCDRSAAMGLLNLHADVT